MKVNMDVVAYYQKKFLCIELVLSIIAAVIIIILFVKGFPSIWTDCKFIALLINPVFPVIATICVTLLGFIMTGVSVLISFTESGKMSLLKESVHYKTLFEIFFSAIKYLAITAVFAIFGIFSNGLITQIVFYFTMWGVIISSLRTYRCIWALEQIIKIIGVRS